MTALITGHAPHLERPEQWRHFAACAETDPAIWFPEKGQYALDAIRICQTCPVREDCLQEALDHNETHGVWGGLTPNERRFLDRTRRACAECGELLPIDVNAGRRFHSDCYIEHSRRYDRDRQARLRKERTQA